MSAAKCSEIPEKAEHYLFVLIAGHCACIQTGNMLRLFRLVEVKPLATEPTPGSSNILDCTKKDC